MQGPHETNERAQRNAIPDGRRVVLGEVVRRLRSVAQLDRAELAAAAGLASSSLSRIEVGKQGLSATQLGAIARVLGTPRRLILKDCARLEQRLGLVSAAVASGENGLLPQLNPLTVRATIQYFQLLSEDRIASRG